MSEKVVIGYYASWATYRNGPGRCSVNDIDPYLCTHLIYCFAGIDSDGSITSLDSQLDLPEKRDNYRKFNAIKKRNKKLKTLLAVGGWNAGSAMFSRMAASTHLRNEFVKSAVSKLVAYGFDGLDIDWEYPNQRDTVNGSADIDNFTRLLRELRTEFDEHDLLLTASVSAAESSASKSYNIAAMARYLDYVNLMAYDMNGAWSGRTGHNAPLSNGDGNDVNSAVQYWLQQGCPPRKLVLGLPFYGHSFTLKDANRTQAGDSSDGPGIAGPYTATSGTVGYNEIVEMMDSDNWREVYDREAEVPYIVRGRNWISYDNSGSLAIKARYAARSNLAGVMIWSIDTDDIHASYPLLKAVNRALGRSV